MPETWKSVPEYENYEISDLGRVRSLDRVVRTKRGHTQGHPGKELSPTVRTSGHLAVTLCRDGERNMRYVHRLVLEAFRGPCPPGHEACHWDDDPSNNRLENLRWGTREENRADMVRNGNHFNAAKTHCKHGHEFTPENTYIRPSGYRTCRTCMRESGRRNYVLRSAA